MFLHHEIGQLYARPLDPLFLHNRPPLLLEEPPDQIACLGVEAFDPRLARQSFDLFVDQTADTLALKARSDESEVYVAVICKRHKAHRPILFARH